MAMNYVIEYVEKNGIISKLQLLQRNHKDVMTAMNAEFDSIKEFIGVGHVETVRASPHLLYLVHDEGNLRGMAPNQRFDLEYLKGKVVIVKTALSRVTPEIIGTG